MTGMAPLISRKLFAGLLVVVLFRSECLAQDQDSGANPKKAPVPPTLPSAPSPIQYFRRLLEAPVAEREKLLEGRSPEHRRVLTNSVRIYLALTPEDRELRLRAMELRHYLTPLMRLTATNRALGLQAVPESYRALVLERLDYYDRQSPEMRQQLLDHSLLIPVLPTRSHPVRGYTSSQLDAADVALKQWQLYAPAKRAEITKKFEDLYKVSRQEMDKTLRPLPLSVAERGQIEKALDKFGRMQPAERQVVVKSFDKFAGLSPEERRQFLRNAEAWQKMSAEDRQRWRYLVNKLPAPPPLPPGFGLPPPLPRVPTNLSRPTMVATN
jgi:hypothetical protein